MWQAYARLITDWPPVQESATFDGSIYAVFQHSNKVRVAPKWSQRRSASPVEPAATHLPQKMLSLRFDFLSHKNHWMFALSNQSVTSLKEIIRVLFCFQWNVRVFLEQVSCKKIFPKIICLIITLNLVTSIERCAVNEI